VSRLPPSQPAQTDETRARTRACSAPPRAPQQRPPSPPWPPPRTGGPCGLRPLQRRSFAPSSSRAASAAEGRGTEADREGRRAWRRAEISWRIWRMAWTRRRRVGGGKAGGRRRWAGQRMCAQREPHLLLDETNPNPNPNPNPGPHLLLDETVASRLELEVANRLGQLARLVVPPRVCQVDPQPHRRPAARLQRVRHRPPARESEAEGRAGWRGWRCGRVRCARAVLRASTTHQSAAGSDAQSSALRGVLMAQSPCSAAPPFGLSRHPSGILPPALRGGALLPVPPPPPTAGEHAPSAGGASREAAAAFAGACAHGSGGESGIGGLSLWMPKRGAPKQQGSPL